MGPFFAEQIRLSMLLTNSQDNAQLMLACVLIEHIHAWTGRRKFGYCFRMIVYCVCVSAVFC